MTARHRSSYDPATTPSLKGNWNSRARPDVRMEGEERAALCVDDGVMIILGLDKLKNKKNRIEWLK